MKGNVVGVRPCYVKICRLYVGVNITVLIKLCLQVPIKDEETNSSRRGSLTIKFDIKPLQKCKNDISCFFLLVKAPSYFPFLLLFTFI